MNSLETGLALANGSSLESFVDFSAAAWCTLRKVDSRLLKTKGVSDKAGFFGDKTPLNRRIVRSMSVAGRAEVKYIVDDKQQVKRSK